jgi:hypothetical protein
MRLVVRKQLGKREMVTGERMDAVEDDTGGDAVVAVSPDPLLRWSR